MTKPARVFHLDGSDRGASLVDALARRFAGESRTTIRAWILGRRVQVHGNLCVDPRRRLGGDEVLHLWDHPLAPPATLEDVRILHADEHLVVVEKPAGVTSSADGAGDDDGAGARRGGPTLDVLVARALARRAAPAPSRRPRGRSVGAAPGPIRPVHRLDRETSGVMVFARTGRAEERLLRTFATRAIDRAYLAVVHGAIAPRRIESWLVRDRGDGLRGSSTSATRAPGAKHAVTHVRPVERLGPYTLVECRLETGRTHQIRIHLAEAGHRVCGERLYVRPLGGRAESDRSGAPRLALHAADLGFRHPITGRELHFHADLPDHLAGWIDRLRREARRDDEAPDAS